MPIFTAISHADFLRDLRVLADAIAQDAGWRPSLLVGIGRGGLVPAVYLSHATGVPMRSVDYSAQADALATHALAALAALTRVDQRLMFVDDINDSGRTTGHLRTLLRDAGAVEGGVRFATLIDNVRSAQRVDLAARTIDRMVTKDWFVFPWESVAPADAIAADAAEVPQRTA